MTALTTSACQPTAGQDGGAQPAPTVIDTVTLRETVTATPSPRTREDVQLSGDQFNVGWTVQISERDGQRCLTARADGISQRVCGDPVELDELHGGREVISAVEFEVSSLDITAGLVAEPVARVRVETAPPPEDPGGGATENVEPVDALVGLNAYAEADLDPTPEQPDLPTRRVVALDATGDQIGEVDPSAAEG